MIVEVEHAKRSAAYDSVNRHAMHFLKFLHGTHEFERIGGNAVVGHEAFFKQSLLKQMLVLCGITVGSRHYGEVFLIACKKKILQRGLQRMISRMYGLE